MNAPFFAENPLVWSGEPTAIEEWAWSDGAIAVTIGCGIVGAAALAALVIAIGMSLGRLV